MATQQMSIFMGEEVEKQGVQKPAKKAKHYAWLDALVNLDVTVPQNEEQDMLFSLDELYPDDESLEIDNEEMTEAIADGIFLKPVKKAELPSYDKSNVGPAILAKSSGNALNYIEDPFGRFCELEIKQLEKQDKRRVEEKLASLQLRPNIIATTLLQLFYDRRRYSQRLFEVSLAKFSMHFDDADQERIYALREDISKHVRHQLGELPWQAL